MPQEHQLTDEQYRRWAERVDALGLDHERHMHDQLTVVTTGDIDAYKDIVGLPAPDDPGTSDLTPDKARNLSHREARVHAAYHMTGKRVIGDPEVKAVLSKKLRPFAAYLRTAPNRRVTRDDPLIIDSPYTITEYGEITFAEGGYIKITINCHLRCDFMRIEQGGAATPGSEDYLISVVGEDGADGGSPSQPPAPPQAAKGNNAECDGPGGCVKHQASNGSRGTDAVSGGDGLANGDRGQPAPSQVFITIREKLESDITLIQRGGHGGAGGDGAKGATGGRGGNGGAAATCGGCYADAGNGGPGANGGNGGNGKNGGRGGDGGELTITYPEPSEGQFLSTLGVGKKGRAGSGGEVGDAGTGGASGGSGGSPGGPGKKGTAKGMDGDPGEDGDPGTIIVNGAVVN